MRQTVGMIRCINLGILARRQLSEPRARVNGFIHIFEISDHLRNRAKALPPGGGHTYAKGDDQYPNLSAGFIARGSGCHASHVDGTGFIEFGIGNHALQLSPPRLSNYRLRVTPDWIGAADAEGFDGAAPGPFRRRSMPIGAMSAPKTKRQCARVQGSNPERQKQ